MGRKKKHTVDYFPHNCKNGKVVTILEGKWGNDGYAFFYRLLQLLGDSEGHYIDCRNQDDWEYLVTKMRITEELAETILAKLADLKVIDPDLWITRIIWDQDFVNDLEEVYRKRRTELPKPPEKRYFCPGNDGKDVFPARECHETGESAPKVQQSIVEYSKAKQSKQEIPPQAVDNSPPEKKELSDLFLRISKEYPDARQLREVQLFLEINRNGNPKAMIYCLQRLLEEKEKGKTPVIIDKWLEKVMAEENKNHNARDSEAESEGFKHGAIMPGIGEILRGMK